MDLLKKSVAYAFVVISVVFTFVPEAVFGKIVLISKDFLEQFALEEYVLEINIIANRILVFLIVWFVVALIYKLCLHWRKRVTIKGNNYKITVEYGDLFKTKKCKRVINFDECFSTHVGTAPADIKPTVKVSLPLRSSCLYRLLQKKTPYRLLPTHLPHIPGIPQQIRFLPFLPSFDTSTAFGNPWPYKLPAS